MILIESNYFVFAIAAYGKSTDMRALTVDPSKPNSLQVEDVDDPRPGPDELLVAGLAMGVCGTDKEIEQCLEGQSTAPAG